MKIKIKNWDDKEDYTKDYSAILEDLISPGKHDSQHLLDRRGSYLIVPNPSNRTNRHDIYCFERDDNDYMETGLNGAVKQTLMLFNLNVLFRVRRSS